jgi:hypothetical protein
VVLKEAVAQAIAEVRERFPGHQVHVREDGEGGAVVTVDELDLGGQYVQKTTWLSARIVYTYPHADVYPLYCRGDLARVDGRGLGDGTSAYPSWEGKPAVQLSRRSNQLDPDIDRADLKFLKVLEWLRSHQ